MGSPVEVIPGWSAITERLDSTLVQLNRLMHYYADVTPDEGLRDPDPSRKVNMMQTFVVSILRV